MELILHRDGIPVEHPPFWPDAHFYFAEGMIGITAQEGWTFTQQLLDADEHGDPVVIDTVLWSVVAAPPLPDPEPPTIEDIRKSMRRLSRVEFKLMLRGLGYSEQQVSDAFAQIADPELRYLVDLAWREASYYRRSDELIDPAAAALGMEPEDTDAAWLAFAASLPPSED